MILASWCLDPRKEKRCRESEASDGVSGRSTACRVGTARCWPQLSRTRNDGIGEESAEMVVMMLRWP